MSNAREEMTLFDTAHNTPGCQYPGERCGKSSTYTNLACRGESCLAAHREYKRDYKNRIQIGAPPRRRPAQAIPCKTCGKEFIKNQGEAGTKYCSNVCKQYHVPRALLGKKPYECHRCHAEYTKERRGRERHIQLCPTCRQHPVYIVMSGTFAEHQVPVPLILQTMEWPYCANEQCGEWLLSRAHRKREDRASSRYVYNFAVDHDHACCPKGTSCGKCVRGILCRACNSAIPHTHDALKLRGLAEYLVP